jgi:hypothetical protein
LRNNVFNNGASGPTVAQQLSPVMQVAYPVGQTRQDRQTNTRTGPYGVFAYARAWRTPNNTKVWKETVTSHLNAYKLLISWEDFKKIARNLNHVTRDECELVVLQLC